MRTKTIHIYTFDELSDKTKERVRDNFRQMPDLWPWGEEYWQSAKAFSAIAPSEIIEADYDRGQVSVRWKWGADLAEISGVRAWKWLVNNGWFDLARKNARGDCTLTGFCGDCDLFDVIFAYEGQPSRVPELQQVFYECAQSWVHAARRDFEHSYSDEAIDELIECNGYEFDEMGALQ